MSRCRSKVTVDIKALAHRDRGGEHPLKTSQRPDPDDKTFLVAAPQTVRCHDCDKFIPMGQSTITDGRRYWHPRPCVEGVVAGHAVIP